MVSDSRRDAIDRDFEAVKDDLRKLRIDTGTLAKDAYDASCSKAADARAYLSEGLRATTVRGKLGLRMAGEHLSARPRTAVAAAFGVGLVLGLFLLGRRAQIRASELRI